MPIRKSFSNNWPKLSGVFGQFEAPGTKVPVSYLQTFASLASDGSGNSLLSQDLVPVRELFSVGELDFNELIQRDIDDHRVATEMIPYLLNKSQLARFFPPILAVLLPTGNAAAILDSYPVVTEQRKTVDGHEEVTSTYGQCIEVKRFENRGRLAPEAELSYNPQQTRIAVIDGQHRAMAMLAIRRTKENSWGEFGRDYKHFYEDLNVRIEAGVDLSNVTLPVCLCFFPELNGKSSAQTPKRVCRRLFLDVNRTARRPTKARTLLLDDADAVAVLSRGILSRVRSGDDARNNSRVITIDAFEYDSPKEAPVPKRPLAICSVEMLAQLVYWSSFAPDAKYNLGRRNTEKRGRKPKHNIERFLREINSDKNIPAKESESWGYTDFENQFDCYDCPISSHDTLIEHYNESWGDAILLILESLQPFSCHIDATSELRATHDLETGARQLAYKALFDGQGILWTLQAHAKSRAEDRKTSRALPEVGVEKAYRFVQDWIDNEFVLGRAARLFGVKTEKVNEEMVKSANRSYGVFRTQAFQVGTLMAFAYLKEALRRQGTELDNEAWLKSLTSWLEAWNEVFVGKSKNTRVKRARAFDKDETEFPGFMSTYSGSLKPSHWPWFQYFTFEYVAAAERDFLAKDLARAAALELRKKYLERKAKQYQESVKKETRREVTFEDALKQVRASFQEALANSVGLTKKDFKAWYSETFSSVPTVPDDEEVFNDEEDEESERPD